MAKIEDSTSSLSFNLEKELPLARKLNYLSADICWLKTQ
jgi:hypothetical protein